MRATGMRSGVRVAVVTVALGLLVASCFPADSDQPEAEPPLAPAAEVAAETGVDAAPEAEGSGDGEDADETLAPIEGYGDFSGETYHKVDWVLWSHLVVRCMRDQGFPAEITPPDGISYRAIPDEQNEQARRVQAACEAGLNTPEPEPHTREFIEKIYEYSVALRECLIGEGYDIPEPPTKDTFVDNFWDEGSWAVWRYVPDAGMNPSWDSIKARCPSRPVGGWGAWEPGDPIEPLTQPDVDLDS